MRTPMSENGAGVQTLPPRRGLVKAMIVGKLVELVKTEHPAPTMSYCPRSVNKSEANSDRCIITH